MKKLNLFILPRSVFIWGIVSVIIIRGGSVVQLVRAAYKSEGWWFDPRKRFMIYVQDTELCICRLYCSKMVYVELFQQTYRQNEHIHFHCDNLLIRLLVDKYKLKYKPPLFQQLMAALI